MRKTEVPHNSVDQVHDYLRGALDALEQVGIAADSPLAPIAYAKAVDLLAAKQIFFDQAGVVPDLGLRRQG